METRTRTTEIIVHCTATPEGRAVSVPTIRQWHKQAGYSDIGYHYVIYIDGTIHKGREEHLVGAHTIGRNATSIGVCYVGGLDANMKPKDTRTEAQKKALLGLLKDLRKRYPLARIYGHRDFARKACPSFDAKKEYENI